MEAKKENENEKKKKIMNYLNLGFILLFFSFFFLAQIYKKYFYI